MNCTSNYACAATMNFAIALHEWNWCGNGSALVSNMWFYFVLFYDEETVTERGTQREVRDTQRYNEQF